MIRMSKLAAVLLALATLSSAADVTTKKYLNLDVIKTMVAGAEAEAQTVTCELRSVLWTIPATYSSSKRETSHLMLKRGGIVHQRADPAEFEVHGFK